MMKFNEKYNHENFLDFLNHFLPKDFLEKEEDIVINKERYKEINKAKILGFSESLDLYVLEMDHARENDPRIAIATDAFKILADHWIHRALVVFKNQESDNYRFSFLTISLDLNDKNKAVKKYSNARRYSFYLGLNAKINTPTKFLIFKGKVTGLDDLKNRFSIEIVNKEFYKEISKLFIKLVGGSIYEGKKKIEFKSLLKLPSSEDKNKICLEFGVRLIGRIIFCWFLREKKSDQGKSLMPNDLLSLNAVKKNPDYYHKILEPIFFEVLNKQIKSRKDDFSGEPFSSIPYLNGGLFSPHDDDYYKRTNGDFQSQFHNTLVIPDVWLIKFFEVLETYNFTIDENTSFDEELSIDPEMLGRIFENLLAEINPETGESARKSTGSYYTPRVVVDYMVDESLLLYLKNQTQIDEEKLRTVISYDLNDDEETPLKDDEKEQIINALEKVKILDPACGSGAFPIGALQKIVFILQQTDPDGKLWFKKQTATANPEFRRDIEKKFSNNELDFIRKLGVIRNSIYGVDIQPIATEISRLRCFLTLIVDEVIKDSEENRGIKPLPNLDFKFVTANSLIGLPKIDDSPQQLLFDERKNIEKLRELMDEFFSVDEQSKYMLMNSFNRIQKDLIKQYFSEKDHLMYEQKKILSDLGDWDPFVHKTTNWFDPEWMFGIKDGFDIVIANPPYFRSRDLKKDLVDIYSSQYKLVQSGFDLATLFVELADKLINQTGIISFIVTNKIFSARYAIKLREYLIRNNRLNQIINLYSHLFESTPVETTILIITYNNKQLRYNNYLKKDKVLKIEPLFSIDPQNYLKLPNKIFIFPVSGIEKILLNKLSIFKNRISDFYNISAGYGITGIQNLLNKNKIDSQTPVYTGKCIWAYYNLEPEYYINRDHKFNTISDSSILIRELSTKNRATIIKGLSSGLVLNSITVVEAKSKIASKEVFLAIFNSLLFYKIYCLFYESTRTHSNLRFKSIYLNEIPFPDLAHDDGSKLIELVNNILDFTKNNNFANKSAIEGQIADLKNRIDQIVYELYGLTEEEIKIVEGGGTNEN